MHLIMGNTSQNLHFIFSLMLLAFKSKQGLIENARAHEGNSHTHLSNNSM